MASENVNPHEFYRGLMLGVAALHQGSFLNDTRYHSAFFEVAQETLRLWWDPVFQRVPEATIMLLEAEQNRLVDLVGQRVWIRIQPKQALRELKELSCETFLGLAQRLLDRIRV